MNKLIKNKYFKFAIVGTAYVLWVFWVWNFWLLLGLPIVFDIYVTKKVNWTFWKKREGKNNTLVEWLDALIFAVVAVTFINIFFFQNYKIPTPSMEQSLMVGDHLYVSKLAYGPRIPNTPLSFPFVQHTMPFTQATRSFLTWLQWPYKRLAGFSKIKNDDVVVFNFPEGDTVVADRQAESYYAIVRDTANYIRIQDSLTNKKIKSWGEYVTLARTAITNDHDIVVRPVDKTDNYIKRCVAIPGDTLRVIDGEVYINGKLQRPIAGLQYRYWVYTNGNPINFKRLEISEQDVHYSGNNIYNIPLTEKNLEKIKSNSSVVKVEKYLRYQKGEYDEAVFPHSSKYHWNHDNMGPVWIPKKGVTISLNLNNLPFYERIISCYEKNSLQVKDSIIYINGKEAKTYTFKMDYYWMMGDNRHNSLDSRFWGFVPEDHVIGKPKVIWLSVDQNKSFFKGIRWNRMFMIVK
jgi:signal peptidase I